MRQPPFLRTPPLGWQAAWLGIPYIESGRNRAAGLDCWGLAMAIWDSEFSYKAPDPFPQWSASDFENMSGGFFAAARLSRSLLCQFKRVKTPALGCAVVFRLGGQAAHVGLCSGNGWFIHSQEASGSTQTRLDHLFWRRRIENYYEPI